MPATDISIESEAFVAWFADFWSAPDAARIPEIVAPDATIHWPGSPPIRGDRFGDHMAGMIALVPDIRLTVVDHAAGSDWLFIAWSAQATINDRRVEWTGVDRFRLRDGMIIEEYVEFDPRPVMDALAAPEA